MISEKIQTRILCTLIAIGAFLRFYQIGFQCYWTEEQYTLVMAKLPFSEILNASIITDCNPPLYYLVAHAVMIVSGFADIAIRYPSVVCGILLIPAMFSLGYVYKNQMTGLYCAGFTTILFPLVYYSQFGRAYSMSFLFFVLSLIIYIRIKDGDHSYGSKALFGILAAINIWIHLFAIIPVGLMILDLILCNGRKMTKSVILTGILCSPLIYMPLSIIQTRITTAPAGGEGQGFGMSIPQILFTLPYEFFSTVFPYSGILMFVGIKDIYVRKEEIGTKLIAIAIITIIIGIFCSLVTPFFPRYFLTVAFIFILVSAVACANFTESLEITDPQKLMLFSGILAFLFLMQSGNYLAHYFAQKYVC